MKFIGLLLPLILICLLIIQPASAYLDPGFGSMVWQMIVAVGFGIVLAVKLYWQKFKNYFSGHAETKLKE